MHHFPPSAATDPSLPHDSRVSRIVAICSAMLALVTVVVGARFWIRCKLVKTPLGTDDWCILAAWMLAVFFDCLQIPETQHGLGRHIYDLPPSTDSDTLLELYYFGELSYFVCVAVTKIAILNLYLRLAAQTTFRKLIWACMGFVIVAGVASVIVTIFQCNPIHKAWDVAGVVPGTCININALFFANAAVDIFQDALIYILPMRMIYQLQVPKRQKIALMLVFAVGGFVVITGMVRLNSLKLAQNTPDPTYNNYEAAVWSAIESNVGVVCASLPTFKALIDRFFPCLMGHVRGASTVSDPSSFRSREQGYKNQKSQLELDLENGVRWNDSDKSYCSDESPNYSVSADGNSPSGAEGGEEHEAGNVVHDKAGGIWRSTSVTISRVSPKE